MNKKFLTILRLLLTAAFTGLFAFAVYGSDDGVISYRFDDVEGFVSGSGVDGVTFDSAVTRGSTVKTLKGEYYYNYAEFKNDGYNIINRAITFYVPGNCDIYITACSSNSLNCYLCVNGCDNCVVTPEIETFKRSWTGSAGNTYLRAEPYLTLDDYAKIRIFSIVVVPQKTYSSLGDDEEIYWNFGDFESKTITEEYTESDLTIYASEDKYVDIITDEKDTEAGFRYYKSLDLKDSGSNSYRSVSFFAYPDSDIYITAYHSGSSEKRTLYFTNEYCSAFYDDDGVSQDIAVGSSASLYQITYNGTGETVYLRSADSSVRICDIRIVKHDEGDTTIVENGSWNFTDYAVQTFTTETDLDGLTVIPGRGSYIISSDPVKYLKLLYGPYNTAGKISLRIGDSTGSDKYRSNKTISIKLKSSAYTGSMYVVDKYGNLITKFNFTNETATYNFTYDGYSKDLIFYPRTETAYIYEISVEDTDEYFGEVYETASVAAGETYSYFCTVYNLENVEENIYIVSYNQDALEVEYVGYGDEAGSYGNIQTGENITVVSNSNGFLEFKVSGDFKNWSGILALVEFEALSTGNTTIGFDYYKG